MPVLSEQMTDTHPRVSTAFRSLMMACCLAIFWVPMAWTMVMMEPRASGMAATARATANMRASSTAAWWKRDMANTTAQMAMMQKASFLLKASRLIWRGVRRSLAWFISAATRPSSVDMPVAVTTTAARP